VEHIQLARQWADSGETESKKTGNEKETSGVKKKAMLWNLSQEFSRMYGGPILQTRQGKAKCPPSARLFGL
jgi:hypothetical protein